MAVFEKEQLRLLRRLSVSLFVFMQLAFFSATTSADQLVSVLNIETNESVDLPRVMDLLGLKQGDRFDPVVLDQGIARLALTGDFQSIISRFDDSNGRLDLFLLLHNRMSEVKINFPYFKRRIPSYMVEDIKRAVGLAEGHILSQDMISDIRKKVLEAVKRRGFIGVEVVVVVTSSDAGVRKQLEITINGGEPRFVRGLSFIGFEDRAYRDFFAELRSESSLRPALTGIGVQGFKAGTLSESMIYDLESLSRAKERFVTDLRERGYYDINFNMLAEGPPESQLINFVLNKGPLYEVHIVGATAFWERDLRERLLERSVKLGLPFNVVESTLRLQRVYKEIGFADVVISREVEEKDGLKKVVFTIKQGKQYFFKDVIFKGARPSELAVLEPAVQEWLRPLRDPFHHIYYNQDLILGTLGKFVNSLRNQGFLEAAIVAYDFSQLKKDSRFYTLELNVRLGRRFRVRNINVLGNIVLSGEELDNIVSLESGAFVSPQKALRIASRLQQEYQSRGFMGVELSLTEKDIFQFPREKGVVDVTYSIIPGPQVKVGRVIVEGADNTKDHVLLRELNQFSLEEGAPMSPEGISDYQQRLLGLGLFASVDIKPVNGRILQKSDATQKSVEVQEKDLRVAVRERPAGSIEFGPGYRTDLGAIAFAELNYRNLGGWNRSVFLRSQVSRKLNQDTYQFPEQKYSIVYLEPYLFDWRMRFRTELDYRKRDDIKYKKGQRVSGYNSEESRLRLSVDRELFRDFFWSFTLYEFSIAEIFDIVEEPESSQNYYRISSTGMSFRYDKRNNVFDPSSGYAISHSFTYADPQLGGGDEAHFINWKQQYNAYVPLGKGATIALSGVYARTWALRKSNQIPVNKRLVLGGRSSVRSLPERWLRFDQKGVLDQQSLNLRAEYRQPIFAEWGAAVFVEGGQVDVLRTYKGTPLEKNTTSFRKAAGVGFRYSTPVGPVALDFGYNMDFKPGEDQYRFNLSIGSF